MKGCKGWMPVDLAMLSKKASQTVGFHKSQSWMWTLEYIGCAWCNRDNKKDQSINDFVTKARTLAQKCQFTDEELNECLIELIIASTSHDALTNDLYSKPKGHHLADVLTEGWKCPALLAGNKQLYQMGMSHSEIYTPWTESEHAKAMAGAINLVTGASGNTPTMHLQTNVSWGCVCPEKSKEKM